MKMETDIVVDVTKDGKKIYYTAEWTALKEIFENITVVSEENGVATK
jgi:hypothetical protein